jgi:hypothetical protein
MGPTQEQVNEALEVRSDTHRLRALNALQLGLFKPRLAGVKLNW